MNNEIRCDFFNDRSENRNSKITSILDNDNNILIYCEHDNTSMTLSITNAIYLRKEMEEAIESAILAINNLADKKD